MEVIVYPSGQLLKGPNPENPPRSTIGPRLEAALRNSFYRNQGRKEGFIKSLQESLLVELGFIFSKKALDYKGFGPTSCTGHSYVEMYET